MNELSALAGSERYGAHDDDVAGNEVRGFVSQSEIEKMSVGNYRRFDG